MVLGRIREWFDWPERQVLFLVGLIYGNSLATYILQILVTFLTGIWKLKLKHAVAIMNIQGGVALILEILMASLIDSYLGHYWMLLIASIFYCIGLGLLSMSVPGSSFKGVKKCPAGEKICASKLKASPFYWALFLIIVAKAGLGICLKALTFDKLKYIEIPGLTREKKKVRFCCFKYEVTKIPEDQKKTITHGCFRFKVVPGNERNRQIIRIRQICIIVVVAGIVTGIFRFSSRFPDWSSRFKICAYVMGSGIVLSFLGFSFHPSPQLPGSPMINMLRVFLAALLKNHGNENQTPQQNNQRMTITNRFRCLNNAVGTLRPNFSCFPQGWISCEERQVEETKHLLRMLPISATFLLYGIIKSNSDTFFIEQARAMDRSLGIVLHKFPIQFLNILAALVQRIIKFLYRVTLEERVKRIKGSYSDAVQIGLGLLAALGCCGVASLVEEKRLKALREHGLLNNPNAIAPISMFWLTPQFILMGIMDGLARDGMVDFFKHQAPASVRRYGVVFTDVVIGWGKLLNTLFVTILDLAVVKLKGEDASWFADNVNGGHLDYFYRTLVAVSLVNLFIYAYAASFYSYQAHPEEEGEGEPHEDVENVVEVL